MIKHFLFQSTPDGEDTDHGAPVQSNAELESKPELDHVLLETNVVLDVQDHQLKADHVELLLVRTDWLCCRCVIFYYGNYESTDTSYL